MTAASVVEVAGAASPEPASAAVHHCTVAVVPTEGQLVVVTIICGELHTAVVMERITSVTRVPGHIQPVVFGLTEYNERTVLGVVPAAVNCLQVKSHLVAAGQCQLTE